MSYQSSSFTKTGRCKQGSVEYIHRVIYTGSVEMHHSYVTFFSPQNQLPYCIVNMCFMLNHYDYCNILKTCFEHNVSNASKSTGQNDINFIMVEILCWWLLQTSVLNSYRKEIRAAASEKLELNVTFMSERFILQMEGQTEK